MPRPLETMFHPKSVAVIGASERPLSVGKSVLWNLISNRFGGTVYPVNPTHPSVLGVKSYASIAVVPEVVDLAVIATPAKTVPGVIRECGEAGVRAAVVLSAGFKEIGAPGIALEQEMLADARRFGMRIIGPNCLGVMSPTSGLNATFSSAMALRGNVAFVSQSGALCTAILDWSLSENLGFSHFISVGSMVDVGWADLLYFLDDDPATRSIVMYMESINDAREFFSAAREVAPSKPIILIKAGRTAEAAKAATSHTGALAGSDDVLGAVFARSGVLRVDSIADLFYLAETLEKQPRPRGKRLAVITNAGGLGVLAVDDLVGGHGALAPLTPETLAALDAVLPEYWSHANPIDILGDADSARYGKALEIVAKDPTADGLLVLLAPQAIAGAVPTAELISKIPRELAKPLLASWVGGAEVAPGAALLRRSGIPTFSYPDTAARVFNYLWQYDENLRALYETPKLADTTAHAGGAVSHPLVAAALAGGRTLLTEEESKRLLTAYGIPTVPTVVAATRAAASEAAVKLGFPVVVKLHSRTVTHKSDVGGVHLNVVDAEGAGRAFDAIEASVFERVGPGNFLGVTVQPMIASEGYELIFGSKTDAQFGPVLLFGLGGTLVEIMRDRALALPPLTTTLALQAMEKTRIFKALKGTRGRKPVDLDALAELFVRFSRLAIENPRISEIDVNPLLASPEMLIALDARIVLYGADIADADLPRPAIRPYPTQYSGEWTAAGGERLVIRPVRPDDEPLVRRFDEKLSERSVYYRYAHQKALADRIEHGRLARLCFIDYDRQVTLLALGADASGAPEIYAVGRLIKEHLSGDTEFALIVADDYQGRGLGYEVLRRLIEVGRAEGVARIVGNILSDNVTMLELCRAFGFRIEWRAGDLTEAVLELNGERSQPIPGAPALKAGSG
jgi:acetyltransferase